MHRLHGGLLCYAAVFVASGAGAQCEIRKVLPTVDEQGGTGAAIAVDGGLLVMGEPGVFHSAPGSGRVTTFTRAANGSWVQSGVLGPETGEASEADSFGSSVALSGNVAAIGSPYRGVSNLGGVHFFEMTAPGQWLMRTVSAPADAMEFDLFGHAVAIDGDHAIVGSPNHDFDDDEGFDTNAGAAYFYKRNPNGTWSPNGKGFETDGDFRHPSDHFGWSVALSGEYAVVGVPNGRRDGPSGSGWARVFRLINGQWTVMATLTAPGGGAAGDNFGRAVATDGEFIVVGAPNVDFFNADAGRVHIFKLSGGAWAHDSAHSAPAPALNTFFGRQVAVAKARVAVGTLTGDVYLMNRTPVGLWSQTTMMQDPDPTGTFGHAIATDGYDLAVGDPHDAEFQFEGGASYIAPFGFGSNSASQAARLRIGDTFRACTNWATNDGSATCGQSSASKDVWYVLTVEESRMVSIDTQGSALDTVLSVHAGAPGNEGNQIVCNDDALPPQRWSRVGFAAEPGMFYFVRVAGFAGNVGEYVIRARGSISCPGDVDGDGQVGFSDLNILLSQFNIVGPDLTGDVDLDGDVDFADLNVLLSAYNASC